LGVSGVPATLTEPELLAASAVDVALAVPMVSAVNSVPVRVKTAPEHAAVTPLWPRPKVWLLFAAMLALLGLAYAWWRKRASHPDLSHSIFDDLHLARDEAIQHETVNPFVAKPVVKGDGRTATVMVGDLSMKVPSYKAPAQGSNPEYDLIEQADIYLQFGHDKLAEEVLQEALLVNPNNVQIYLTLLDIYDTHHDAEKFAALALELESRADIKIWERVCKMGKRIDPDNELYGLHLAKPATVAHNTHGGHIDQDLGDLYEASPRSPQP
jgi:pilus assembly protein FimV